MMQEKVYAISFTAAGIGYVRQLLGVRPHDEVRQLIENIERQIAEQEQAANAVQPLRGVGQAGENILPLRVRDEILQAMHDADQAGELNGAIPPQ